MAIQKVSEQKYFQHLDTEHLGKVVKLTGIEEDDDMTLFHFSDGFKCNVEYCAPLNDDKAFANRMIMAEVSSPDNIWVFQDKVIVPETKKAIDEDGQEWEVPDPYYDPKGDKGPAKPQSKKIGIPPRKEAPRKNLSKFGIALEEESPKEIEQVVDKPILKEFNETKETFYINEPKHNLKISPVKEGPIQDYTPGFLNVIPVEGATWTIDCNVIPEICIIKEDKKVLVDTAKAHDFFAKEPTEHENTSQDIDETDPVYILIKKCKKKESVCNLELKSMLPGKSIYNLIKEEYDESDLDKFFDIIINQLDIKDIKNEIKKSLKEAYSTEP